MVFGSGGVIAGKGAVIAGKAGKFQLGNRKSNSLGLFPEFLP